MTDPDMLFDAAIMRYAPHVAMRAECDGDADFLRALFIACSPMVGMLPEAMLAQQADIAYQSFRSSFPAAMRRVAVINGKPVGRLIIDWNRGKTSHCVDIALMPHVQKTGLGRSILQSWISASNQLARPCSLAVYATNPALQLYQRLGFVPTPSMDGTQMSIEMERPAG